MVAERAAWQFIKDQDRGLDLAVINLVVPQLGKIRRASNEKAKGMPSCDKENITSPSHSIEVEERRVNE